MRRDRDDVGDALRAQDVYEKLDAVIQALGALKHAIGQMVNAPEADDDDA